LECPASGIGLGEVLDVVVAISASADKAPYKAIQSDLAAVLKRISERWESESESS